MNLYEEDRLKSLLRRLDEAKASGIPLWELLEWDSEQHRLSLEDSHSNLESLSAETGFISMGGPYRVRITRTGQPIFEPTVRVTEKGSEFLRSGD
jgi:hypothetical protein